MLPRHLRTLAVAGLVVLAALAAWLATSPSPSVPRGGAATPLRVLVLEGRPRWEFRYLRSVLQKEPFRFRSWLASAEGPELQAHSEGSAPLAAPPTTLDELRRYDAVVLGDVRDLPPALLAALATFVDEGGGLVAIAGEELALAQFAASPLGRVLPVVPSGAAPPRKEAFVLEATAAGRALFPVEPGSLPGGYWVAPAGVRDGARGELLARTTRGEPVFVRGTAGKGRVFVSLEDETWRWREGVGDRHFARFWSNVLAWVTSRS